MATVHVEMARVRGRALTGSTMPVTDSVALASASQSSSSTWTASTVVAPDTNAFWTVVASGGDVLVRFDADPVNNGGNGRRVNAGMSRDFAVTAAGEKIAIKDAP